MIIEKVLQRIAEILKDDTPFESIVIKKSAQGKVKRITVHVEHDEYFDIE